MRTIERNELRGTVLDERYLVGECIGLGGTGVVFEATRLADGARVAIKTIRPCFVHNPDLVRRLRREGEVAERVVHPGVVRLLDEGTIDDGSPYLVFEYVEAESLARLLLRTERLPASVVALIGARVASILHAAHAHGYTHRDIKPDHVLLASTPDGELVVRLLDFGVCASTTAPADERERERGRVFGTPSYCSPEQASGNPDVDGRADQFGLAITLYEALTGRLPFTAANVAALLRRIIREEAPSPALFDVPVSRDFEAALMRMLAREPAHRFANTRALERALYASIADRAGAERELAAMLIPAVASQADAAPTLVDEPAAHRAA